MSDILADAREWLDTLRRLEDIGTHGEECHRWHLKCLVTRLADEVERLREERRWVPVVGEIIDMEFSSEIGVYYGTIRCPKCNWEGDVTPMDTRPKCRCGVQWDFSVSAVGEQPLPPGPEGDG